MPWPIGHAVDKPAGGEEAGPSTRKGPSLPAAVEVEQATVAEEERAARMKYSSCPSYVHTSTYTTCGNWLLRHLRWFVLIRVVLQASHAVGKQLRVTSGFANIPTFWRSQKLYPLVCQLNYWETTPGVQSKKSLCASLSILP